ncbi:MAG: OmpH family outer membrane protein [Carboxylicivirga sp.]|jgi:outer membrane protein|nr:OmpH family outer membrane protein [Carboxylicivirga sp.]
MNKITSFIAIFALILSGYLFTKNLLHKEDQIVYVDVNVLMSKYKGMQDAKKEFEKVNKTMQANVDSLIVGFQNDLKEYEKERRKLSKKEIELKQELLRNKQQQIDGYQRATAKKAQDEEMKLTKEVVDEVNSFIENYGKKNNFNIILGATSAGNILYAKKGYDITEEVLEGLNNTYVP